MGRVLVVDDEPKLGRVVAEMLELAATRWCRSAEVGRRWWSSLRDRSMSW